jgi:hypothetical protein
MSRTLHRLSAVKVAAAKKPGFIADGGNLFLRIAPGGSRQWMFRFALAGKTRDAGLGSYPTVSLVKARQEAERCGGSLRRASIQSQRATRSGKYGRRSRKQLRTSLVLCSMQLHMG